MPSREEPSKGSARLRFPAHLGGAGSRAAANAAGLFSSCRVHRERGGAGCSPKARAPLVKWLLRRPPGDEEWKPALLRKENDIFPEEILGRSLSSAVRNSLFLNEPQPGQPGAVPLISPLTCNALPAATSPLAAQRATGCSAHGRPQVPSSWLRRSTSILLRFRTSALFPHRPTLTEAAQRVLLREPPACAAGEPRLPGVGVAGPLSKPGASRTVAARTQYPSAWPARGPPSVPQAVATKVFGGGGCSGSANTRPPARRDSLATGRKKRRH